MTLRDLDDLLALFDWDAWTAKLRTILDDDVREVALEQGAREAALYGFGWDATDVFLDRHFTDYLAERVTQITESTRSLIAEELHRVFEDGQGLNLTELAGRLVDMTADSAAFSPARALTIARTETAIAYNTGTIAAYRQNGIEWVEVSDGDGDEECAAADGQMWTLEDALANPIAHPNCVRSFAPIVPET